jgi:hypothetical protein
MWMSHPAPVTSPPAPTTPGIALWKQRHLLHDRQQRIVALHEAVGRPGEMSIQQVIGLMAVALEFQPDLILELGRLYGNSTCAFTEAANILGIDRCRVTSLCLTPNWQVVTVPRLRGLVDGRWLSGVEALQHNILTFDYDRLFASHRKIMVFWDAHGYDIANCVLGRILPLLINRPHMVAIHDLSDSRYLDESQAKYGGKSLWRHNDWSGRNVRLGWLQSNVEQVVAIVDFASRNTVPLGSATDSMRTEMSPQQLMELENMLGYGLTKLEAGWSWFSLTGIHRSWTFPGFEEPGLGRKLRTKALIAGLSLASKWHIEHPMRSIVRASRSIPR